MYPIPFKDDVRDLLNMIVDHGLDEANHFSKKFGARQDLKHTSVR
jgi:hypothetical protein